MLRLFSLKSPLPWAIMLGACLAASCEEKGVTSTCPPLPLYQTYPLGDAAPADAASADASETKAAFASAVDAGCATAPTDFPSEAGATGDVGGSGGSAGGHVAGNAGGNTGGHAGAAGGN